MFRALKACVAPLFIATFVIPITACGGGTSPNSPSAVPGGGADPGSSGLSFSLSQSTVMSQSRPQGTVTLGSVASVGGVVVSLESSNPAVATVPATVTVPGGGTTASFNVETATVSSPTAVTITARLGSASRNATLTITPPTSVASFTISSPTRGADRCDYGPELHNLNCIFDGSRSTGALQQWIWTYGVVRGTPITYTIDEPVVDLSISNNCDFFKNGDSVDDGNGRYFRAEVTLVVVDAQGAQSAPVRREFRIYPNQNCGFSF